MEGAGSEGSSASVPKTPSLQDVTSIDGSASPPAIKHPSERYSRSEARLDGVSKICSKTIYSAFDNEKCTEVAWIEYRDVPRPVMERFDESLERLMALDHENLVKVCAPCACRALLTCARKYHAGWADRKNRTLVLITEQVTGDLRNWLVKKIEMASKVYVRWLRQLCSALDYLHKAKWVHPDIASNKIFIRGTGELKIGGLAEAFFADVHFADKTFQVGIGAPELANGVRPGPMQNVYQLGICALQVFTFHHPYRAMMLPQIVKAQLENKKPPELSLLKDKDPLAYDLVSKCLEPLETRISLAEVLKHPYLCEDGSAGSLPDDSKSPEGMKSPTMQELPHREADVKAAKVAQEAAAVVGAMAAVRGTDTLSLNPSTASMTDRGSLAQSYGSNASSVVVVSRHQPLPRFVKCYVGARTPDAPCIRIRVDTGIATLEELKKVVTEEFASQQVLFAETLGLRYRDADGDLVIMTARTTLQDVLEYALHLELHPLPGVMQKSKSTSLLGLME